MLLRYSSLQRLLRITAWCRRWLRIHRQDHLAHGQPGLNSADEIEDSRISLVKIIQAETYKEELRHLKNGKPLPTRSSLLKLSPFLDSEGLLRVGGRLKHAALQYDATHPTILPSRSNFTCLIIDDYHKRTLHGGTQLTLCSLRQEYWVPRGRALVKSRISRCLRCTRWRAAIPQPLMGDLPAPRVTPGRPFLHTGVDYAGPIWMRTAGGRGLKATKGFVVFILFSFPSRSTSTRPRTKPLTPSLPPCVGSSPGEESATRYIATAAPTSWVPISSLGNYSPPPVPTDIASQPSPPRKESGGGSTRQLHLTSAVYGKLP
ncbi:uncharacterized protein LOC114927958 [Nylanderia fulva]|uniref:uncharacterized protein LOC114927958 n=1 Tax=Nylanderia fulva TaxID=613905 RepID=UPI0010FADD46|nr:uncharacterized protein LOC114927958 [Nylanderia fulva]